MWAIASNVTRAARRAAAAVLLGLSFAGPCALGAEIDQTRAAGVMAAYLRHIAALTTWPGTTPVGASAQPIRVGVIGGDPNGVMRPIRDRVGSGEALLAQGRPILLVELTAVDGTTDLEQLSSCNLLFLSEDAEPHWPEVRSLVDGLPIVTVSEMTGFADQGGMIEYFIDHGSGKVHMKANIVAMRSAGISMSARFLTLNSVVVIGEREEAS